MLVQSISDLENTTNELNMELESLGDDDGGEVLFCTNFHILYIYLEFLIEFLLYLSFCFFPWPFKWQARLVSEEYHCQVSFLRHHCLVACLQMDVNPVLLNVNLGY